jgi:hypothetical protein
LGRAEPRACSNRLSLAQFEDRAKRLNGLADGQGLRFPFAIPCSLPVEIDRFVLAALDAGADLSGRPALLRLLVRVEAFLGAGGARGSVQAFKATAQAGMAQGAVAAAVAGELVSDAAHLGDLLIYVALPGILKAGSGELGAMQDGRKRAHFQRRRGVIGGHVAGRVGELRVAGRSERGDGDGQGPAALAS